MELITAQVNDGIMNRNPDINATSVSPTSTAAVATPSSSIPPGFRLHNSLKINTPTVMYGSAVITVSAIALIVESIIVVISGGSRYPPVGLLMSLCCITTGGRGVFGNFEVSGIKSSSVMIILTVCSLILSIWATYNIKQSLDIATKRINSVHVCLNVSDTYSSCDAINTAYLYLSYSFYTSLWCLFWLVYILIVSIQMHRDMIAFVNRRAELQLRSVNNGNAAERQSLLSSGGRGDESTNINNDDGDEQNDVEMSRQKPSNQPENVMTVQPISTKDGNDGIEMGNPASAIIV